MEQIERQGRRERERRETRDEREGVSDRAVSDRIRSATVEVTRSKAHRPHGDPPQINLWPLRGSEAAGKRLNKVVGAEGVGPYRRVK